VSPKTVSLLGKLGYDVKDLAEAGMKGLFTWLASVKRAFLFMGSSEKRISVFSWEIS